MSSALAIAAVTASLKDLLNDGLLNHDLSTVGSFSVTASPPDRITTGLNEPNQLNLFLYQVTANLGWRNADLPSRDASGARRSNPPLALDLHYLLTAYGAEDLNAEILLGYAMQLMHESPVLTRAQIRTTLGGTVLVDGTILPGPFGSLSALDLASQVEMIKISPVFLSSEELSKMWTAMQARYRPTMAYTVSVVLIQSTGVVRAAPPVLSRGPSASATGIPFLARVRPAASDLLPAMRLGDDLLLTGTNLTSSGMEATFENTRAERRQVLATTATEAGLLVHLPTAAESANALDDWAIGNYSVSLRTATPGQPSWSTNQVPIALSPRIDVSPLNAAPGPLDVTVECSPRLQPDQTERAQLIVGETTVLPISVTTPADPTLPTTLVFHIDNAVAGSYLVRLRVEGIDSLPVKFAGTPPALAFDETQRIEIA